MSNTVTSERAEALAAALTQDAMIWGMWIVKTNADGSQERVDPLDFYLLPAPPAPINDGEK